MPKFNRYVGIDYSGAETCDSSCKGLRVCMAEGPGEPKQVKPTTPSLRRYWTRRGLAEWLCAAMTTENAAQRAVLAILSCVSRS